MEWRDIESAPKGGGAEYVTDPNWVEPPRILMRFGDEGTAIVYWDWSYSEGGYNNRGQRDAWIIDYTIETSDLHFSNKPTHWMPLPKPPTEESA